MEKLKELLTRCKCGVHLTVNEHRDKYKTVSEALEVFDTLNMTDDLAPEVRQMILETDTIIDLHFYPETPVGFHHVLHFDVDLVLQEALMCLTPIERNLT